MNGALTTTSLTASATEILLNAGYSQIPESIISDGPFPNARAFEDDYGIVLLTVWETLKSLLREWTLAQAAIIELISARIPSTDPKASEGYLVLLCPASTKDSYQSRVDDIRYDTTQVRKIISTGDDLVSLDDVNRALAPLLPLDVQIVQDSKENVLEAYQNC